MLCRHLAELERQLIDAGIPLTFRGQAWTNNCREWAYFACWLDGPALRRRLHLDHCVVDHVNDDPRSGRESGLVCSECHDAVIGVHADDLRDLPTFA
jgi:hypothetical protein